MKFKKHNIYPNVEFRISKNSEYDDEYEFVFTYVIPNQKVILTELTNVEKNGSSTYVFSIKIINAKLHAFVNDNGYVSLTFDYSSYTKKYYQKYYYSSLSSNHDCFEDEYYDQNDERIIPSNFSLDCYIAKSYMLNLSI